MVFGLPCWVFFSRHNWSPWYWSLAKVTHFKCCAGCGAIRWRSPARCDDLSHPVRLPPETVMDDGRTWAEHLLKGRALQ